MADVVTSPNALPRAVDVALAAPARQREARRAAHALFANVGRATQVALDVVYELLELDRPPAAKAA